jgi:hypothetical protein
MERVRTAWANMRMQSFETSFAFRKRVEDYQLERASVGLEEISADELIICILNRLDMSRYHALVKDYLDNERRGIADLPELPSILWKEIKDTQVVRFKGTGNVNLQAVYLSRVDELDDKGRGRGRRCRGGRGGRGGYGRGRGPHPEKGPPAAPTDSIKPSEIICWTCGKKGHRSTTCPTKNVHFSDTIEQIFLTCIENFHPSQHDNAHEDMPSVPTETSNIVTVLISKTLHMNKNIIMLDTQSPIHLVSNAKLLSTSP